ncbi:hypothetical protein CLV62_11093 [Dysgonomonas alginatilytica]|uniref:Uncharacterized protein n=1 Tax=Dysgonomonas alginatilytica TaxID=1605892 RepID=A0A2V3PPM1_9BACT|nr:hypothetical protein [Dysgonomonas alginatilytica]PXV64449.1 hypothetical protein CLV62_11093 [Dysgonomonas alginatilytica]
MKKILLLTLISVFSFLITEKVEAANNLGLIAIDNYHHQAGKDYTFDKELSYEALGINAPIISDYYISGKRLKFTIESIHMDRLSKQSYLDLEVVCKTGTGTLRIYFY